MIINVFCSASAKEIKNVRAWLLPSLEKQTFEGNINLYIINYNSDSGIVKFDINKNDRLKIFELSPPNRVGFGEAHNFAFDNVNPEKMFLIVNPDVYLTKNCIANLINKMEQSKDTAIVEARQLPFEHPKEYDPATGETPWASGFCCLIDSTFFKKVGGFDVL
jgi:GT2 family glycosyltransferase